jgi:hypothetical protein
MMWHSSTTFCILDKYHRLVKWSSPKNMTPFFEIHATRFQQGLDYVKQASFRPKKNMAHGILF